MGDNRFSCGMNDKIPQKTENVSIDTNRILDSCRDKDCFEDVKVILTDFGNELLAHTTNIRAKNACVAWAYIGLDPVRFNRGFYSVTIKFYVKIIFEACLCGGKTQEFEGVAILEKKVILYGGESNVSVFKSQPDIDFCTVPELCCPSKELPVAVVEVVDPIILNTKVREPDDNCCCCCCCCNDIPESIARGMNGHLSDTEGRYITISFGLFSVVRIVRPGQYLIHATEYCVPEKECVSTEDDDPCAVFRGMAFPTAEFCPPGYYQSGNDRDRGGKCGCGS